MHIYVWLCAKIIVTETVVCVWEMQHSDSQWGKQYVSRTYAESSQSSALEDIVWWTNSVGFIMCVHIPLNLATGEGAGKS